MMTGYENDVNCYITKPLDFEKFISSLLSIENYWLVVVNHKDEDMEN